MVVAPPAALSQAPWAIKLAYDPNPGFLTPHSSQCELHIEESSPQLRCGHVNSNLVGVDMSQSYPDVIIDTAPKGFTPLDPPSICIHLKFSFITKDTELSFHLKFT